MILLKSIFYFFLCSYAKCQSNDESNDDYDLISFKPQPVDVEIDRDIGTVDAEPTDYYYIPTIAPSTPSIADDILVGSPTLYPSLLSHNMISNDEPIQLLSPHPTPFLQNPFVMSQDGEPINYEPTTEIEPTETPTTMTITSSITPSPTPFMLNPLFIKLLPQPTPFLKHPALTVKNTPYPTPIQQNPVWLALNQSPKPTQYNENPAILVKKTPYPTPIQLNPVWVTIINQSPKPTIFNENPAYPSIWDTDEKGTSITNSRSYPTISPIDYYYSYESLPSSTPISSISSSSRRRSSNPTQDTYDYYQQQQEEEDEERKTSNDDTPYPTIHITSKPSRRSNGHSPKSTDTPHPHTSSRPRSTPTPYPTPTYLERSHVSEDDDDLLELLPQPKSTVSFQQVMVATFIRTMAIMAFLGAVGVAWFQNRDIIADFIQRHGYTPSQTRYAEVEMPDVSSGGGL